MQIPSPNMEMNMEFFQGFMVGMAVLVYVVVTIYVWIANQLGNGSSGNPFLWPYRMVKRWVMAVVRRDGRI